MCEKMNEAKEQLLATLSQLALNLSSVYFNFQWHGLGTQKENPNHSALGGKAMHANHIKMPD